MSYLVLVRHGQSEWNLENRFTGDVDVQLTEQGRKEARMTGEKLKTIRFNVAFTSALVRAQQTLRLILEEIGQTTIPIYQSSALNERRYGDLQGLNKAEIAEKYGETQVHLWRRSFDVRPPGGESLKDTQERVIPYYEEHIEPLLKKQNNVLIVAHGNSLRALLMHIEKISANAISQIDIPTGVPRLYEFDNNSFHMIDTTNIQ